MADATGAVAGLSGVRIHYPGRAAVGLGDRTTARPRQLGAAMAELVSGSGAAQGLAWCLLEAGNRVPTAELLAALVCLAVLGLLLNAATRLIERRLLRGRT